MIFNRKIKVFFLILLILIFIGISYISIILTNFRSVKQVVLSKEEILEIEKNLNGEENYSFEITVNKNPVFYNVVEDVAYYYLSEENANQYVDLNIKIASKDKFKYAVTSGNYDEEKGFYVDFEKPIELIIYNEENYYKKTIKLTCVPIVNITVGGEITSVESASVVEVYAKDNKNENIVKTTTSEALIYLRGQTSAYYPKKQYRLKLRANNTENQISLLGMEADEDWILDALYSDYSKIRNKLSFDLWNEMNSVSGNTINNDLHGEFVEVYINHEYNGIYLLKEFLDWKKLDLDKNNEYGSGILVKGAAYAQFSWDGYDPVKNTSMVYPFVMKYPKSQEDYTKYWDTVMPKIYTNFFDKKNITEDYLLNTFDIYNYNDYKLLMNFICAADNFKEKNAFISMKNMNEDTKLILTPWDLDMTYGYAWGQGVTSLYEEPKNLERVENLWVDSENINNLLKDRYWQLRKEVYNMDNINQKIDSYYNQIKYIVPRDSEKWLDTDLEEETNKIRNWLEKRIEILDEIFR